MSQRSASQRFDAQLWATTSARLMGLSPAQAAKVLTDAGIEPSLWQAQNARYGRELAAELARGERRLANLYAARCVAERQRRRDPRTASDDDGTKRTPGAAPEPSVASAMTLDLRAGAPAAAALPFRQGEVPARLDRAAGSPPPVYLSSGTAALSGAQPGHYAEAPVPFGAAPPTLTVQQYAQVCALLWARPEDKATIYPKYGLVDDDARAELDRQWRDRLAADATSRALFDMLFDRMCKQLRAR